MDRLRCIVVGHDRTTPFDPCERDGWIRCRDRFQAISSSQGGTDALLLLVVGGGIQTSLDRRFNLEIHVCDVSQIENTFYSSDRNRGIEFFQSDRDRDLLQVQGSCKIFVGVCVFSHGQLEERLGMPQTYHRGIPEEHGVRPGGSGCVDGCMPERVFCLNFAAGYGAGSFDSVDRLCLLSSCDA